MPHDNVKSCEMFGKLKDNHMMSPTLIQIDHNSPWSSCSAAIVTNFLDAGHGKSTYSCLYRMDLFIMFVITVIHVTLSPIKTRAATRSK